MNYLKKCDPQILLYLFTYRPIESTQLNSLTTIITLRQFGGAKVTHPLWVRKVRVQIPALARMFTFNVLLRCYCVLLLLTKTHYFSQYFAMCD